MAGRRQGLTDVGALWHGGSVDLFTERGLIIIDVVKFDGELCLRLQLLTRALVHNCGSEYIKRLFLTIQAAGGMQVAVILVDDEDAAGSFTRQDISDHTVAMVLV